MKIGMLEKLPPEVLIYIQNVRKFLTSNEQSKEYFQIDTHGEEFFDEVIEQAHKNFEESGSAELTVAQFEELRDKVTKDFSIYSKFVSLSQLGEYGFISLN